MPESWQRAVTIFRDAIRENPTFSPCYSSLVQMNNIEHFVHPGFFRDLGKARATLELAKTAVQLDPVDSRAHLCCGWSYVMALREAEAAPHMELACELNDNDPWTLLSLRTIALFADRSSRPGCGPSSRLFFRLAPSYLGWGYHGIIRLLCGDYAGALEAIDRARSCHTDVCPHGGRRRCFTWDSLQWRGKRPALPQWNTFVLGRIVRADRRGHGRWALAGASDQHTFAVGNPARRIAWRRASCRGYHPTVLIGNFRSRS